MDYEKKLALAKEALDSGSYDKETIEYIFPELKESEDERIRKELIEFVKSRLAGFPQCEKFIAWLEKQGTSYTKKDVDDVYLKGVTDTKKELEKQYEETYQIRKDIATFIFNYRGDIKDRAKWMDYLGIKVFFVEKQGEHTDIPADAVLDSNKDGLIADTIRLKSRFKVGDWIVDNNVKTPFQITGIANEKYDVISIYGNDMTFSSNEIERFYHLWAIQDAKNGDVLCTYECVKPKIVFILKGTPKKHYALDYYCYYNIMYHHFESDSEKGCLAPNDEDVKPATKEQRDLLFQKMKEDGYEWDAKKKELKKIEQESSDKTEPKFEIGDIVQYITDSTDRRKIKEIDTLCNMYHTDSSPIMFEIEDEWKVVVNAEDIEQEPAWSEEDETTKNNISHIIRQYDKISKRENQPCYYVGDCLLWMQNIKDRVQPQPKQEWSKEEEEMLNLIIARLHSHPNIDLEEYSKEYDWLKNKLKFIKPQSTWKPSDEQMKALGVATNISNVPEKEYIELEKLYQDLKKLREG